jgi:hypothetical protein
VSPGQTSWIFSAGRAVLTSPSPEKETPDPGREVCGARHRHLADSSPYDADEEAMAQKIAASWDHVLDLTLAEAGVTAGR